MHLYACFFFCAAMSVLSFFAYGLDKRKAKRGKFRTPEKILLGFSLAGGAVGSLLGMALFRHKTKHWYFSAVGVIGLLLWTCILLRTWTWI